MTAILGLAGGPDAGGRTTTAVAGILAGAADKGAKTEFLELSRAALPEIIEAIEEVDAIVFGSPVYRATYSALLKGVLEGTERGKGGRPAPPCRARRQPSS